jgi:demethylmenaquinone methyltransferase/2-methoxy-6-polyprenyl-1,4-benzoquinol methylase
MAATYGVVNLIASFGFAARWRHQMVRGLPLSRAADVVDLMSGMSELCRSIAGRLSPATRVTAIDLSPEMIRRARKSWPFTVDFHLADVLAWQFDPDSADVVICSFGLKTFDLDQQTELARHVARMLRPGGVFSFMEISVPPSAILRVPYLFYLTCLIPRIGRMFLGNPENYRMLSVYTRAFGDCGHFARRLREQGLEVAEVSYFLGCATGVRGKKPASTPQLQEGVPNNPGGTLVLTA